MKSLTKNLFEEYRNYRSSQLTLDQFKVLLRLFPSLLVCLSDGKFDEEERKGMRQNMLTHLTGLESKVGEDVLKVITLLSIEMDYLAAHFIQWKEAFLSAVRYELMKNPDDKEYIFESLYLFANIHNGICIQEQLQIDELVNHLSLVS